MIRLRTLIPMVALLFAACSLVPAELQRELLPSNSPYKTAEAAYQVLIERHVDKPTSQLLLGGALVSVQTEVQKEAPDATFPSGSVDFTGSTWSDFAKFSDRVTAVLTAVPKADKTLVERAAVDGMAKAMNECHTYYLDPNRAKGFNQPQPPVSGIGVTINKPSTTDPIEVVGIIPGTPAEKAGIKVGDKIVTVDGTDVTNLQTDEVANRVRGQEGTQVMIGVLRGSTSLTFTLSRARFAVPLERDTMLDGNIGRIEVPQLVGPVADEVSNAVKRLDAAGANALILDLRGDPGGDLSAAVDIASIFVRQGTLVYQTGRDGNRTPLDVNRRFYINSPKPLVVLVNKNSASGAEIIAAGIRANDVGVVIGSQTAGCVGTGQPRDLPDGGLLLVTITKIQDAKTGADLNGPGRGIVPDQVVDQPTGAPTDAQLNAAVAYLKAKIARSSATDALPLAA
ncbi:MAG: PDZ domain-containing protein [Chloroflexi bacterium]|nr:MAG: PDZ domain-containing protein [Chloroflexota bacterium]TMF28283.1 MAG: PDZ domain-containing protein [Chloroflexota bacterium]